MALTPKQRRFVGEYLKDLNSTQAAIRAGYSAKDADVQGPRLLGNVGIQAEIQRLAAKHFDALDISGEHVLSELARLAFSNMADYITVEKGEPRIDLSRVQRDQTAAIVSLHITKDGIRLKLADKRGALELLGKYQNLFIDRHELLTAETVDFTLLSDDELTTIQSLYTKANPRRDTTPGSKSVQ